MTHAADEARRRNARKSTGPRTAAGKARVARNALRHGLSVPLRLDPAEQARIETLAAVIAADTDDARTQALVTEIAEAQLEIIRVRDVRQKLLDNPVFVRRAVTVKLVKEIIRFAETTEPTGTLSDILFDRPDLTTAEKVAFLADELARLDRYERRALSRRKFLIREYDALRA